MSTGGASDNNNFEVETSNFDNTDSWADLIEKEIMSTDRSGRDGADEIVWSDYIPEENEWEDSLSAAEVKEKWNEIYKQIGLSQGNEKELRAVRCGVYVYGALNGTSRAGKYSKKIKTADGRSFPAAVIVRVVGKFHIRQFFRGNMTESYNFFTGSRALEKEPKYVKKMEGYGISFEVCHAAADWFAECPWFTPQETAAYTTAFNKSIERARRARGGRTLEQVEAERLDEEIKAQGHDVVVDGDSAW